MTWRRQPFYLMVYDMAGRVFTRVPDLKFSTRAEADEFVKEHKQRFDNGRFRLPCVRREH